MTTYEYIYKSRSRTVTHANAEKQRMAQRYKTVSAKSLAATRSR